jgi:hypothetical protein
MDTLLAILSAYPTFIFSTLMLAAVLYWLLVIVGMVDLHLFDHDVAGHDGHEGENPFAILDFLRVGQVPLTIIVSTFIFLAWSVSLAAVALLHPLLPLPSAVAGSITLGAALILAFLGTGWAMMPLAALFSLKDQPVAGDLIGRMVEVTSSTVDARFGTARHDKPSGEDLILNVVCAPQHTLTRGEQAVVLDYDRATGVYTIAPLPHTRPGFLAAPAPVPDPLAPAAEPLPVPRPTSSAQ